MILTRRQLLLMASAAAPVALLQRASAGDAHLTTVLRAPSKKVESGEYQLGLAGDRDGLLIVPARYRPETPAPLAVMLHGAGGMARRVASLFSLADEFGIIVLAPESRGRTWDAIRGQFGPDIEFLNRALAFAFDRCAIDRRRMAIGGFSDGATYGLSVGIASGDLFTHVIACSPGFIIPGGKRGHPSVFISHGTADQILPINVTSRRIVPDLERDGYAVKYREFDGQHTVPPAIAREAFSWFLGR